jgi:hypothetical protein
VVGLSGTTTVPAYTSGVLGVGSGAAGVVGYTSTAGNHGIFGTNTDTGTNSGNIGVEGDSAGSNGTGVYGSNTNGGYGVYGYSPSGYAVYGITNSGTAAVYGTTAYSHGVEGVGTNTGGIGVYGTASAGSGVYGVSTGTASNDYGVYGTAVDADAIHAVYTGTGGSSALAGIANTSGNGVYGSATATGYYAGLFNGNTSVNSGYSYYYNGTATCVGGHCASDARLKKGVESLSGALDRILALRGVTFEWKTPEEHAPGRQTGFIAQEVEKVFPTWVDTDRAGMKGIVLPPMELAALEVESIRALKTENDDLRKDNEAMKADVAELRSLVYSMNPSRSGFTSGNGGWGAAGLILGLAAMAGRRKKDERSA